MGQPRTIVHMTSRGPDSHCLLGMLSDEDTRTRLPVLRTAASLSLTTATVLHSCHLKNVFVGYRNAEAPEELCRMPNRQAKKIGSFLFMSL